MDEWVGLDSEDIGSCRYFLNKEFFLPLNIRAEQIHFFNGKATSLIEECKKSDLFISQHGCIDIMLLGIGMNGHLGLNEPGVSFELLSHVVDLDQMTKHVGQKYFEKETLLTKGITLGCLHILQTKHIILQINGEKKAEIAEQFINSDVTNNIPATILKKHNNPDIFLDLEAAQFLSKEAGKNNDKKLF